MTHQNQKQHQLERTDRSNKQSWDKKITKLCNKINKKTPNYTTSSCSGRIILLKSPDKKQPNLFLFRSHNKITYKQLKQILQQVINQEKGLIYFKQDACILHVCCPNLQSAEKLLIHAKIAGWKRSGIFATQKRIICELLSTEKIELPIADKGQILVSDDYLKLLVKQANKKLKKTWKKIDKLEKLV